MTVSINLRRKVDVDDIPGPDFTTYSTEEPKFENGQSTFAAPVLNETSKDGEPPCVDEGKIEYSYDSSFAIYSNNEGVYRKRRVKHNPTQIGRGLACKAYAGRYWSITLRSDAPNQRAQRDNYAKNLEKQIRKYARAIKALDGKPRDILGYCPRGHKGYSAPFTSALSAAGAATPAVSGEIFLNDIYPLAKQLYDILNLDPDGSPFGLVVITGATDSSKSLITRGLIFLFLEAAAQHALTKRIRRPHLVTFEDPIEQYFIKNPRTDLAPEKLEDLMVLLAALNLDYTPRQKGVDADSLTNVLRDAKRQTPAVLFVGETRDPRDWKELLDFGSSGHLVFTTAHSGSVVEAMSQILRNTRTETPSQRSEVARRIRGIINIRSFSQPVMKGRGTPASMRALLPAVWKSTSQSINNLVADGLSSILPALDREEEIGYYGRTYFAKVFTQTALTTRKFKQIGKREDVEKKIVRKAKEWDIRGI